MLTNRRAVENWKRYKFENLKDMDESWECPGIYAWYCSPYISDELSGKLEKFIEKSAEEKSTTFSEEDRKMAKSVFKEYLAPFERDDYTVKLEGKLMAKYEGTIQHKFVTNNDTLDKFLSCVSNSKSLDIIKKSVESKSIPVFASPVYIGMAKNLKNRIEHHIKVVNDENDDNKLGDDLEFGKRINNKDIEKDRLIVYLQKIDCDEQEYELSEYLLNRINYPLLGGN